MYYIEQEVVDKIVQRCRNAVDHYGGQSDELKEVRKRYQMFHDCTDGCAYVLLDVALKDVGF
jgi:hypothetical protein